jgi:hypothetical protein
VSEKTPEEKREFAWQPLTFRGVAAFGQAALGRLLLLQLICASLTAFIFIWVFGQSWFPTIIEAVRQLPSEGEIRAGRLDWRGNSPQRLAEGHFLALVVDLKNQGQPRSPAHVQVFFGQTDLKVISLFGFLQLKYPQGWRVAFNRAELEAWWGAWKPAVLAIATAVLLAGLLLFWGCLATVYFLPAWLIAFFANRSVSLGGAWRVAGAALLPGALFLAGAVLLYGLGFLDLIRLLLAGAAHFLIGWAYLIGAALRLPVHPALSAEKSNPFAAAEPE